MGSVLKEEGWTNAEGKPDFTFNLPDNIHPWWRDWLANELKEPYMQKISASLMESHQGLEDVKTVFPPKASVFKVFEYGPPSVVVLGQDPYHQKGNAMGLAFSVPRTQPRPASLLVIYKELAAEGLIATKDIPKHGDLSGWAQQSVMLLNTALTVREASAGSHLTIWRPFIERVFKRINTDCAGVVFMLWGSFAHAYEKLIDTTKHHVIKAGHPSPLNTTKPFIGCGHFKMANELLVKSGKAPMLWSV